MQKKAEASRADRFGGVHPGRPKGCKNKFTGLKDSALYAFQRIGGNEAFADWAAENRKAFYHIVMSMLPKDIQVSTSGGMRIILERTKEPEKPNKPNATKEN